MIPLFVCVCRKTCSKTIISYTHTHNCKVINCVFPISIFTIEKNDDDEKKSKSEKNDKRWNQIANGKRKFILHIGECISSSSSSSSYNPFICPLIVFQVICQIKNFFFSIFLKHRRYDENMKFKSSSKSHFSL